TAVNRYAGRRVSAVMLRPLLGAIRIRHRLRSLDVLPRGNRWIVRGVVNPPDQIETDAHVSGGEQPPAPPLTLLNTLSPETQAAIRTAISQAISARSLAVPKAAQVMAELQAAANSIRLQMILKPRARLTPKKQALLATADGQKVVAYIGTNFAVSGYSAK